MKNIVYTIAAVFFLGLAACEKLDVPPLNVVQDKDIFSNEAGITAYMARIYFNTCTLLSRYIAVHLAGSLFEFIFADILRREGSVFARLSSSLL